MKVELIDYTEHPDKTVAVAARLCYSPSSISDLSEEFDDDEVVRMIRMLRERGHLSPFEHAQFVVGIEGLSRTASHQLVRSRIASYSQQSQRYIGQRGFDYVVPPSVKKHPKLQKEFERHMSACQNLYEKLRDTGIPKEDARFVLPQASASSIIMSKNARAWLEWFELRMCTRAQWEIRHLAEKILEVLRPIAPHLMDVAGPSCETQGLCREGGHSCGRIEHVTVDELPFKTAKIEDSGK